VTDGIVNKNPTFTVAGRGFIEFRGDYISGGTLTLNPGADGVNLDNAIITLNAAPFEIANTNKNITLMGSTNSITANGITLGGTVNGETTAGSNNLKLTNNSASNGISVTGPVGGTVRLGDIEVQSINPAAVNFTGNVTAKSYTQTGLGSTTFVGTQEYSGFNTSGNAFEFTGTNLTVNGAMGAAFPIEPILINNANTVQFDSPIQAVSFTQSASNVITGTTTFGDTQNYTDDFKFTGRVLNINSGLHTDGAVEITNSGLFTKAAAGGAISTNGGFEQTTSSTGTNSLGAGITTTGANSIIFSQALNLIDTITLNSSGGTVTLPQPITSTGAGPAARSLTVTAGGGTLTLGTLTTTGNVIDISGGFTRSGTGNTVINGDITTNNANAVLAHGITFSGSVALNKNITMQCGTGGTTALGNIELQSDISGGYNLTLTARAGTVSIGTGTASTQIVNNFIINSSNISDGAFTVNSGASIQPNGLMIVNCNTTNNGTITAGPIAAGTPPPVAITFNGNYTAGSVSGSLVGSLTPGCYIDFFGDAAFNGVTHNDNIIRFRGPLGRNHDISSVGTITPRLLGDVIVVGNNIVNVLSGNTIGQSDNSTLTLEPGTTTKLDTSDGSWYIGTTGTPANSFTGYYGYLNLGAGSTLVCNGLNLLGVSATDKFTVNNPDHAVIEARGNVDIQGTMGGADPNYNINTGATFVNFTGNLPELVLRMSGSSQDLKVGQPLGILHVSETIIGGVLIRSSTTTLTNDTSFRGGIEIDEHAKLIAGAHDIYIYAGREGKRNLTNYTLDGADPVNYAGWKNNLQKWPDIIAPTMNSFVFRQDTQKKVVFKKDPDITPIYPVFFEIEGDTMWRTFECFENGAVIQFSVHPDQHIILEKLSVHGGTSSGPSFPNYVTLTRLTRNNPGYPYIYDYSKHGEPPGTPGVDINGGGLPASPPPHDLKLPSVPDDEREKYWNINLYSGLYPLAEFRYNRIFFSHAYDQRIPIETERMFLDALPYYRAPIGHFNYDWVELRKILYSFTEASSGDGRLDRIRVQTNVRLNGKFDKFDVKVEGYEIDKSRGKGKDGFDLVSEITKKDGDKDSFYIYLKPKPDIDNGNTPLWSVTHNETLMDELTENSLVGNENDDVNIRPIDTIPPRIAYSLTLPDDHPQTYVRMSEPVISRGAGTLINEPLAAFDGSASNYLNSATAKERTDGYTFTWKYLPLTGGTPYTYTLPIPSGNLGYLLGLNTSLGLVDLAAMKPIFNDTTSSPGNGYFKTVNMEDQAQRALDWRDQGVDPFDYIYYQAPKYPMNWKYTKYATVHGNSHLKDKYPLLTDDDSNVIDADLVIHSLSDVFIPPNKMLTVEMMTELARVNGNEVSAHDVSAGVFSSPNTVYRRVTDVLVSLPPDTRDSKGYFAWPVWARYKVESNPGFSTPSDQFWGQTDNDNGIIWLFDGTKFLEARDIRLQAWRNPLLLNNGLELFFACGIGEDFRNPKIIGARGKGSGGLWLPAPGPYKPLFYYAPVLGGVQQAAEELTGTANYHDFLVDKNSAGFRSGVKFDFIFRLKDAADQNMFVARLDAPRGIIPENWYTMVRPFSFDLQDVTLQRGGVTILNNVINSNNRENTYIRYHLVRPGRVTIQVFTMDGTLVRTIRRNEQRAAGEWTDTWNGTNNGNRPVARGMYFVRVAGPDIDEIRKVMVVK
jgi:hypothetical protein